MQLSTEILTDLARLDEVAPQWDALVQEDYATVRGLDATNGFLWFSTLTTVFPEAKGARIVVLRSQGEVVALLPIFSTAGALGAQKLTATTSLYGGRNGFLLKHQNPDLLCALLQGAQEAFGPWQSLRISVIDDSPTSKMLRELCPRLGMRMIDEPGSVSPYFPLLGSAEQFKPGMSKGLKQTLRTATNKFRPLGELRTVDIADPATAGAALETVLAIERASWKHGAGTAITCNPQQEAFYRAFFGPASRAGLLFGQLLYLGDVPLAFNFGMLRSKVYTCLKHSQTTEHQALSPSQLLNATLIDSLRQRGAVMYDFMGKTEPHKLRWSELTGSYQTRPVLIYNSGPFGATGYAWHKMRRTIKHLLGRAAVPGEDDNRPSE